MKRSYEAKGYAADNAGGTYTATKHTKEKSDIRGHGKQKTQGNKEYQNAKDKTRGKTQCNAGQRETDTTRRHNRM